MIESTCSWLLLELDYVLAEFFEVPVDTILFIEDIGAIDLIRELGIYALFEDWKRIDPYKKRFQLIHEIIGSNPEALDKFFKLQTKERSQS